MKQELFPQFCACAEAMPILVIMRRWWIEPPDIFDYLLNILTSITKTLDVASAWLKIYL